MYGTFPCLNIWPPKSGNRLILRLSYLAAIILFLHSSLFSKGLVFLSRLRYFPSCSFFAFSSSWLFVITGLQHVFSLLYSKYWLLRKCFCLCHAYKWLNRLTFTQKLHSEIRAYSKLLPTQKAGRCSASSFVVHLLCFHLTFVYSLWSICGRKTEFHKTCWGITWNPWNHVLCSTIIL